MFFNRKHYTAFQIKMGEDSVIGTGELYNARFAVARMFSEDNDRFDRERFLSGVEEARGNTAGRVRERVRKAARVPLEGGEG